VKVGISRRRGVLESKMTVSVCGVKRKPNDQRTSSIPMVDDVKRGKKVGNIHSLTTRLRFRHNQLGCCECEFAAVGLQAG
jgi:hypothetical protein